MAPKKPKLLSAKESGNKIEIVQEIPTDIFNYRSKEFLINMTDKDIPPKGHPDRAAFVQYIREMCKNGVNINGVHIWGSLYYTLNIHKIEMDGELDEYGETPRIIGNPQLRDNDWIIHEEYNRANQLHKGYAIASARQIGKALANNSLLYTEKGTITIGEAKIGDKIFGDDGLLTTITGVFPQGITSMYKLEFSDGRIVEASGDHLWKVYNTSIFNYEKKTTEEMFIEKTFNNRTVDFFIDNPLPLNYSRKKQPISSFLLGRCIANPSFIEHLELPSCISNYLIVDSPRLHPDYLYGSIAQRKSLLKGLLHDSIYNGKFLLVQSEDLAKDICFLIRSLGNYSTITNKDNGFAIYYSPDFNRHGFKISKISKIENGYSTCITVDNESHLFLTNDLVPTHNSDTLVSLAARQLFLYKSTEAVIVFGASEDKQSFTKKIRVAIKEGPKFIIVPNIDKDWKKTEIRFGYTQSDNEVTEFSKLYLYNAEDGNNTEVAAGKTITFFAMDEIGKYKFRLVWEAVVPALRSKSGTYRKAPFFCFTGGSAEKAAQAFNFLLNPDSANILAFDTEGKKTAKFLDGTYRQDCKKEIPFLDFLNENKIPYTGTDKLKDMKIFVSDKELARERIKAEQDVLRQEKDPGPYQRAKAYYPLQLKDILSKTVVNRYPLDPIKEHYEYLEAEDIGVGYDFHRDPRTLKVKCSLSNKKPIEEFPLQSKHISLEAPVMIYDMPRYEDNFGLHVAGVDFYREDETISSDSLGSFYIMRRNHSDLTDPFRTKMVASYTGRPKTAEEFLELLEMVCEFYGATILYEHTDRSLLSFFERKYKLHWLINTTPLQRGISPNTKATNSKGLKPTTPNIEYLVNSELTYLKEELDDNTLGLTRIHDKMLLKEYEGYDGEKNTDRVIAFRHAIAAMNSYSSMGISQVDVLQEEEEVFQTNKVKYNPFGFSGINSKNPFGIY